jgi:hypothetical protein
MLIKQSVVLILLVSVVFAADNIRISGANQAEYWVFVDERLDTLDYKEHFTEKLKVSAQYNDIILKGVFFSWDPSLLTMYGDLHYFDYTVQYAKKPVEILYGRYYATFGRGLVLNQFQDEDFRIDKSLFGLKTDISFFKSTLTLLTGKPRNIFFEEQQYVIKNEEDTTAQIRGANFETKVSPRILGEVNVVTSFGARYVRINRDVDLAGNAFTELYGGNIGIIIGPWETYVEYARQWGTRPVFGGRLEGNGIIASTGLALPGLGISFQFVDYDTIGFPYHNANFRYNEPLTPIESGISVNRGLDEIGYGASIIASPWDFVSIEIDHNKISTHDSSLSFIEEVVMLDEDMDGGVLEQTLKIITHPRFELEISGGIDRYVKRNIEIPVTEKIETKPYVDVTYDFGPFFMEAGYEHTFVSSEIAGSIEDYYDHAASIAIGKPELFVLSLRYERRNRVPDALIEKLGEETSWPLAELSLDITRKHNLRVRVGGEKGGLVCMGGVCREEEPFRGIKMVLTSIF